MKHSLLSFGVALLLPVASLGQAGPRAVPHSISNFFAADFSPSTSADSTAFCAETSFRDSLSGVMRVYYPSGHLKQYVPYANVYQRMVHGTLTHWYEDGRMQSKEEYLNGQRHGELLTFYPDGTPKRRERYVQGRGSVGSCFGPDGYPVPYFGYEQLPLYPGGEEQLAKEITRAIRLTAPEVAAMRRESRHPVMMAQLGLKRQVNVELAVATDGRITGARVVQSTAGFLNEAALRAVTKLKRQFVPARRDGQLTVSYLTVPVFYTLETPYQRSYYPNRGIEPLRTMR